MKHKSKLTNIQEKFIKENQPSLLKKLQSIENYNDSDISAAISTIAIKFALNGEVERGYLAEINFQPHGYHPGTVERFKNTIETIKENKKEYRKPTPTVQEQIEPKLTPYKNQTLYDKFINFTKAVTRKKEQSLFRSRRNPSI